MFDTRGKLNIK